MELLSVPAPELVRKYYYDYAKMVNLGGRTVPYCKDTLKSVHRRVLLAAFEDTKNGKFVKSARIVGNCMGHYHAHGDASIYETLVNLVNNGMMEGRGNFGSNCGIDSVPVAHMRYTEARLHPLIKEIAFKYINYVPYFMNDLGSMEPEYLPTMLPLNLLQFAPNAEFTSGLGVALSFIFPKFDYKQSVKFMMSLIRGDKIKDIPNIAFKSLRIPTTKKLFTNGTDTVIIKGAWKVSEDGKTITITELPPQVKTRSIVDKLGVYNDVSAGNKTEVIIKLERGKYASDIDIDSVLSSKQTLSIVCHNNEIIRNYGMVEIFRTVYESFRDAVLTSLKAEKEEWEKKEHNYGLLQKIKPYLNPLDSKAADRISKAEKLEHSEVKKLLNYSIDTICMSAELQIEAKKQLKLVNNKISNIDEYCYGLYEEVLS